MGILVRRVALDVPNGLRFSPGLTVGQSQCTRQITRWAAPLLEDTGEVT